MIDTTRTGYFREHGDWAKYHRGRVQCFTREVAIGYDRMTGAIHRVGDLDSTNTWLRKRRAEVKGAGLQDMFDFAVFVLPVESPVTEADLNECIASTSNGARLLAERLGVTL